MSICIARDFSEVKGYPIAHEPSYMLPSDVRIKRCNSRSVVMYCDEVEVELDLVENTLSLVDMSGVMLIVSEPLYRKGFVYVSFYKVGIKYFPTYLNEREAESFIRNIIKKYFDGKKEIEQVESNDS